MYVVLKTVQTLNNILNTVTTEMFICMEAHTNSHKIDRKKTDTIHFSTYSY